MSPALTRTSVRLVQDGLQSWFDAVVAGASAPDAPSCHARLAPFRVVSAGRSMDVQGLSLLTPAELARDAPAGVPSPWLALARQLSGALEQVFPRPDARPGPASRPRPAPTLDALPAPLGAWYREQAAASDAWTWRYDAVTFARAPSLMWRPSVQLRLGYLLSLDGPPEEQVPVLGAICAELAYVNTVQVRLPPTPFDPLLASYARAIGASVGQDFGGLLAQLSEDTVLDVSVSPTADLTINQLAQMATTLGRGGVPHLQIATALNVGGGAVFAPAAVPSYAGRPRRPGDPE